ncbi:unnamed protein product [Cochlearia groenlandica]
MVHVYILARYRKIENLVEEEEEEEASSSTSRLKSLTKAKDELAALKIQTRNENDDRNFTFDLWYEPKRRNYW